MFVFVSSVRRTEKVPCLHACTLSHSESTQHTHTQSINQSLDDFASRPPPPFPCRPTPVHPFTPPPTSSWTASQEKGQGTESSPSPRWGLSGLGQGTPNSAEVRARFAKLVNESPLPKVPTLCFPAPCCGVLLLCITRTPTLPPVHAHKYVALRGNSCPPAHTCIH